VAALALAPGHRCGGRQRWGGARSEERMGWGGRGGRAVWRMWSWWAR